MFLQRARDAQRTTHSFQDKRQKRLGQGEESRDRKGNKEVCIADVDNSDRRGKVPGHGSPVNRVQLAVGPAAKQAASSRPSPLLRKGSSSQKMELPGILPIANMGSEGFGPVESGGSETEVRPTATPQKPAEIEQSGGADVKVSQRPSSRGESPKNSTRERDQGVLSLHSGGEPSPTSRNSKVNSTRSRRSSASLHRAVSKANITEVFKVREMELTAGLSSGLHQNQRSLTPDRVEKKKSHVSHVSSVVEVREDAASQASQEYSDESEASDADASEAKQVDEETDSAELTEWEPVWLKLSPLNTFMTRYVSKALGLVPLFDPEQKEGAFSWRSRFKQLVSRLYHWSLGCLSMRYSWDILWKKPCHDVFQKNISPLRYHLFRFHTSAVGTSPHFRHAPYFPFSPSLVTSQEHAATSTVLFGGQRSEIELVPLT